MDQIVARCGGAMAWGVAESPTVYALPAVARKDVVEFFSRSASAELPQQFVARLRGARLFGGGAVISPDGVSVCRDVSLDFGKPFAEHWLLGYDDFRAPVAIAGKTAVVSSALGAGYCHWLLEELPRLLALSGESFDTLFAHGTQPFASEAFVLAGVRATVVTPRRLSHFVCEEAVIPSLVSLPGFPTPRVVEMIREFVRPLPRTRSGGFGEKIFVSRELARRRRITNEAALWSTLEQRGFVKLRLEELSWSEQIAAFAAAKIVVAPHGAGLTNLVFSEPGTRVVECFNPAYVGGYFWRLAAVRGLDYRPSIKSSEVPLGCELSANRLDLEVDVADVLHALD